ncbi:hypothetical protein [Nodularia chucula]
MAIWKEARANRHNSLARLLCSSTLLLPTSSAHSEPDQAVHHRH